MLEPESISQLILYAERHKDIFGFYPAAVFKNASLMVDIRQHFAFMWNKETISLGIQTDQIYGIRLIYRNGTERESVTLCDTFVEEIEGYLRGQTENP